MVTAYDFPSAQVAELAGVDMVLVGDSAAMTVLGYPSTVPVSTDELIMLASAVRRGLKTPFMVADLPFGSYEGSNEQAVATAQRFVKEGGAEAVKLEGGRNRVDIIRRLVNEEIPVMGHIGLTPQSLNKLGSYRLQAKTADTARALVEDAQALEEAGVFAIVLEVVPREIARMVTEALHIPTIGIGAGADCDAQILVTHDLLGLSFSQTSPRFVRQYANARDTMNEAISRYADDVRAGTFPSDDESYPLPADAAAELGVGRVAADKKVEKS
jgi:3-methyl-2-oxobutanoate hydroxymethyltransferase